MRICLVSRELAPFFGGGIGTYIADMAAAYAGAGHEVHVLTEHNPAMDALGAPPYRNAMPGVTVHLRDMASSPQGLGGWFSYAQRSSYAAYAKLRDLHAATPFDLIEFPDYAGEGYFALRARRAFGAFAGAALVVKLHTTEFICQREDRQDMLNLELALTMHIERAALCDAPAIVAPSQAVLDRVRRDLGDGLSSLTPTELVPLPLDIAKVRKDLGADAPGQTDPTPTILYYGRLQYLKGVDVLVEAAQRLFANGLDARLVLIGADHPSAGHRRSMRVWLDKTIEPRWRDRIIFEPPRPRRELGEAIRRATVCCFPSRWDSFSIACLEAMSLGAAVVTSDAGRFPELLAGSRAGVLTKAGDAASLAEGLRRVLTDAPLRAALAAAAPGRVASLCDPKAVVGAMEAFVGRVRAMTAVQPPRDPAAVLRERPAPPHEATDVQRANPAWATRRTHAATASDPLVSIIIPFYNLAPYLPQAIQTARGQTFTDCEVIVIDDGSPAPDATALMDRLEREAAREGNPRFRIMRQRNMGLSAARNAALREARGAYILPLDADDVLPVNAVELYVGAMAREPELAVVGGLTVCFNTDPARPHDVWIPLGYDRDMLPAINIASAYSAFFDRRVLEDVGGWDPRFDAYEDWDLHCGLAERGYRCMVLPEVTLLNRIRPDSMFRSIDWHRHTSLRSMMAAKHPRLAHNPDVALRMLYEECRTSTHGSDEAWLDPRQAAIRMINENWRYRVADRLNSAVKATGLHAAIKRLLVRRS